MRFSGFHEADRRMLQAPPVRFRPYGALCPAWTGRQAISQ